MLFKLGCIRGEIKAYFASVNASLYSFIVPLQAFWVSLTFFKNLN